MTNGGIVDFEARLAELRTRWQSDADLVSAYLYGSRARGAARADSDVDLAVILSAELTRSQRWQKRLTLLDEASSALRTDAVDLIVMEEAPATVAHRVVRDGRLIVDRDSRRRVAVVEDVLRRYLDEAWLRRVLDEGLRARLEEGRFAR
jgi:hypothetical protein